MTKAIEKKLKQLPKTPGVYRFYGAKKQILYVGKAIDLKSRVGSYFRRSADLSGAKQLMMQEIRSIEWTEVESEIEALLLEANMIKKYAPKYNVLLRDDKSYAYINVTTNEEWPRVRKTRTIGKSGMYFGPFTSGRSVMETLKVIRKLFPYRCNQKPIESAVKGPSFANASKDRQGSGVAPQRPCFWYHIGRCPGTCVGAITKTAYKKQIRLITLFLEGRKNEVYREVKKRYGANHVAFMDDLLAHAHILSVGEKYMNDLRELKRALGLKKLPERIEGYDIANLMGKEATGAMVVFTDGEADKSEYKKFKIKTVDGGNDTAMLKEVLMRRLQHRSNPTQPPLAKGRGCVEDPWTLPDLIIVDGGKAQLNVALSVLKKERLDIPILAVAKGGHGGTLRQKEDIYFPGEKKPLQLSRHSPALHVVLRVRDETHRFAIGYHKKLRSKKVFQ